MWFQKIQFGYYIRTFSITEETIETLSCFQELFNCVGDVLRRV